MKKIQYLEIARGIAAILVVMHHATLDAPAFYNYSPFNNFFLFGKAGVDFFFVLSGFIIYYIHSEDSRSLANILNYILKRLIRVYPIFLFVSILLLGAYTLLPQWSPRVDQINLTYIATSFLLLPSATPPLLSVSWTLIHEMLFYFLFILMILNKKIGAIIFVFWAFIILSFNLFSQDIVFPFSFYFNNYNLEFLLGMLVAYAIKSHAFLKLHGWALQTVVIGVVVFLINGINVNYDFIGLGGFLTTIIFGLSSGSIIFGLATLPSLDQTTKLSKMLLLLGGASYSIYLIHNPIQSVLHRFILVTDMHLFMYPNLIFLLISILCIFAGILLHVFIEKPMLNYFRKKLL